MRANPLFVLIVTALLAVTGFAALPADVFGGGEAREAAASPAQAMSPSTDWIDGFAARLEPVAVRQGPAMQVREPFDDWRLVGLVQSEDGSFATLASGGEVRTLGLGDRLGGFDLVAIQDARAVFRRGQEERSLRLPR